MIIDIALEAKNSILRRERENCFISVLITFLKKSVIYVWLVLDFLYIFSNDIFVFSLNAYWFMNDYYIGLLFINFQLTIFLFSFSIFMDLNFWVFSLKCYFLCQWFCIRVMIRDPGTSFFLQNPDPDKKKLPVTVHK